MKLAYLSMVITLAIGVSLAEAAESGTKEKPTLGNFGIDLSARNPGIKPGDDFNRYASGRWLDQHSIKDDETWVSTHTLLSEQSEMRVHAIFESLRTRKDIQPGSDEQKLRDYYASYMDRGRRDAAGIAPLKPVLDRIAAIDSRGALIEAFGRIDLDAAASPFGFIVTSDREDRDKRLINVSVQGLGLPNRDYYLGQDASFLSIRPAYVEHIARMLAFAGIKDAKTRAQAVFDLETELSRRQWDRADTQDNSKTHNLVTFVDLPKRYPGYDWAAQLNATGLPVPTRINVLTPSAVTATIELVERTPLPVWRDYLTFHAVRNNAGLLSREIDNAEFSFTGPILDGQKVQSEDWKRAVDEITGAYRNGLKDAMGRMYAERYFPAESKIAVQSMVENLRGAFRDNIAKIDWMSDQTKTEAFRKLSSFRAKIGYPNTWRDYSSIRIVPDDLVANTLQMRRYYRDYQIAHFNAPRNPDNWMMTPQTVDAYYSKSANEIVFPAGELQPPYFDPYADAAVNYGGLGGIIGHEMGHGFDSQGSKWDANGRQRNWWKDADRVRFDQRTQALKAQYDQFCPLPDTCVNGAMTLPENISDLTGLSLAYTAYHNSLDGKPAPVIDGLTGDQRFFLSWAQSWRGKYSDSGMISMIKSGDHSPVQYRVNGPLRNFDPWYRAFDVKPGYKMYIPPEQRVRIW